MASTVARANTSQPVTAQRPTSRDKPSKRRKDQRTDIWSGLLRQTREAQARNRSQAVQCRDLIVCGGSPEDQKSFVQSLARPPPPAPPSRNRDQKPQRPKGEVRLSNKFAYGYGHVTLYSPPQQSAGILGAESEEVASLNVHTLPEPDLAYEPTLRKLMEQKVKEQTGDDLENTEEPGHTTVEEGKRPGIVLLLSWKQPWTFLHSLRQWLHLLAYSIVAPNAKAEDPLDIIKEQKLSLTIVVQHVEAQEALEREAYKEETFDYISQCLRTCILPFSGALVYTSSNPPPQQPGSALSDIQKIIFAGLELDLLPLSPTPAKGSAPAKREDLVAKHNVVDRMAITVPSGWDSFGKVRLVSETFSPESFLEAWTVDLAKPMVPQVMPVQEQAQEEQNPEPAEAASKVESAEEQTMYATSDVGSDDGLGDVPASPSKQPPSAIRPYEETIQDPKAHKAQQEPSITVTTKADQEFLANMRTHLLQLEAQDVERAKHDQSQNGTREHANRIIGVPAGEQTGALNELGDVSFNVGGVSYNTISAEAAIEKLRRPAQTSETSRTSTPRPSRREDRESSGTPVAPTPSSKGELPSVDKLEEYFHSLMKKGSGSAGSAQSTPSKPPPSR